MASWMQLECADGSYSENLASKERMDNEITNYVECQDTIPNARWATNNLEPKWTWYNNADIRMHLTFDETHLLEVGVDEAAQTWKFRVL